MAWKLFDPRLEVVFPDGTAGPGSSPCPACRQGAAATPHFHGGHALPSPVGTRDGVAEGHGPLPLSHTPAKCSRMPPARPRSSPAGCFSRCPRLSRGQAAALCPVRPRGRRCGDGPAGGSAGERSKPNKRKITPSTGGGQFQQKRLFPGQGETRAKRQNSDVPPRRAPLPPPSGGARGRGAAPGGAGGGLGAEPGRGPESRGGFSALVGPSGALALLRRNFSRGLRMVPSPYPFLPLSPLRSPTGGVWACARPQELRPLWPGAVDLPEKNPK